MIRGLLAHARLEFRTGVRDRTLLLMTYLFPLAFFAFMGAFMTEMNPAFVEVLIPGMAVFATLAAAMFGLPGPLISARETGVLRSYRVNGVPTGAVLGVPVATTVGHLMVVGTVVAVAAPVVFDAPAVANPLGYALVLACVALVHGALGALVGVISSNTRLMVLWSQLLFLPSVLLGGITVPPDQLPAAFRPIALLLPSTYAMEAFSGLALGGEPSIPAWTAVGVLVAGTLVAGTLARLCYAWDDRGAGRRLHPAAGALAVAPFAVAAAVLSR